MERRGPFSFVGPAAAWVALLYLTIVHAEGLAGLRPFLNLEALVLVCGGTALCLAVSYPADDVWGAVVRVANGNPAHDDEEARRWGEILRHGADSAVGMGWVAALLGIILLLSSVEDVSAVPRRTALALTALFYGLLLSKAVFAPLARRVRGPDLTLKFPRAMRS